MRFDNRLGNWGKLGEKLSYEGKIGAVSLSASPSRYNVTTNVALMRRQATVRVVRISVYVGSRRRESLRVCSWLRRI